MPTLSQQFITRSNEATSFDYDRDEYPDPAKADELFEWLDQNTVRFIPHPHDMDDLISQVSIIIFPDDSTVTVLANYLNDVIHLFEGSIPHTTRHMLSARVHQNCRAAYTYFKHVSSRQKQA